MAYRNIPVGISFLYFKIRDNFGNFGRGLRDQNRLHYISNDFDVLTRKITFALFSSPYESSVQSYEQDRENDLGDLEKVSCKKFQPGHEK